MSYPFGFAAKASGLYWKKLDCSFLFMTTKRVSKETLFVLRAEIGIPLVLSQ